MNFIDLLRNESNNGHTGFTFDGQPLETLNESGMISVEAAARRRPDRQKMFDEARHLVDRVIAGDRWAALRFQEAMTTSDFGVYFADVLDRSVLMAYAETPYVWSQFAKRATIRDFKPAHIYRFDRGAAVLDGPILPSSTTGISGTGPKGLPEITEYPMAKRSVSQYADQLYKFGRMFDISWEAMISDDLDALRDFPELMGRAARRTEEKRATQMFVSSTGPNATFFSDANKNLVHNAVNSIVTVENPALSATSLTWALTIMRSHTDLDGEPIGIQGATLVVPPALEWTARNLIRATEIEMNSMGGENNTGATGTSTQRLRVPNPFAGIVDLAVDYYLPLVNTTTPHTAWYIFANPNNGRPAMQMSFLAGHTSPEMFMKSSNAIAIGGGGLVDPMQGDFDLDAIMYKIRYVMGGTLLDPLCAVASSGAGA